MKKVSIVLLMMIMCLHREYILKAEEKYNKPKPIV